MTVKTAITSKVTAKSVVVQSYYWLMSEEFCHWLELKGQYHGRSMGDIMIFGQNSLTLNFEHCVT